MCLCLSMSTMQLASLHSLIFAVTPSLADTRVQLSTSSLDTPTLTILRCSLIWRTRQEPQSEGVECVMNL